MSKVLETTKELEAALADAMEEGLVEDAALAQIGEGVTAALEGAETDRVRIRHVIGGGEVVKPGAVDDGHAPAEPGQSIGNGQAHHTTADDRVIRLQRARSLDGSRQP